MDLIGRCRELAAVSEEAGALTRPFATPAMARANALVAGWMEQAGMSTRTDAAGNLVGRLSCPDLEAGTLLLGSHLDTVRDAGAYDGPLGVVAAIACVEELRARDITLPFAVDVYGFADEEGLRYGTAYLGSRAVAGTFDPELFALADADGIHLRDALTAFGGDPVGIESAARPDAIGYLEVHIEQGPALERAGRPLGVVTAIAGQSRAHVVFTGEAGHAGTGPMAARRDAACALAEFVLAVEQAGRAEPGLVATVGRLTAAPGAPNAIAGEATASLDVRHPDDAVRTAATTALLERATAIGAARDVAVLWEPRMDAPAVAMDPRLVAALAEAAAGAPLLPSGAGHDAVALAAAMPVGMLFVRCAGGVSHAPAESVDPADAEAAVEALLGAVCALAGAP
jgi:allantoate deiminase